MIRGVHALAICAIVLGGVSVRATEFYATRYQSLPVLDWVESRPPLAESADLPAAVDLARGLSRALPLLTIRYEETRIPILARLDTIVFNRGLRAAAWSELMGYEMDVRDPETGDAQVRLAGPDEVDGVWLVAPPRSGGVATIAGHRGPVGFMLQVTFARPGKGDPAELADISARAEAAARQASADWTAWLESQLSRAS